MYTVVRLFVADQSAVLLRWGSIKKRALSTSAVRYCFTTKDKYKAVLVSKG
jgi:hypothetical protein